MDIEALKQAGDWVISAVERIGFPTALCIYLVFRFEGILDRHTKAIDSLTHTVMKYCIRQKKD